MQAPIEVTERSGEVFLLDILSHRMCEIDFTPTNPLVQLSTFDPNP